MKTLINVNKNNVLANNIIEFNENLVNLLSNILRNNPEMILDNLLYYKDSILLKFLISLSQNRKGREFVYDIEMYILMYFQENNKYMFYIESMNDVVNCIYFQLNERNFFSVIEEIQNILYIYKSHIKIIKESMKKLLIRIFYINETKLNNEECKDNTYNEIIPNFLRYCLNRIVFTFSSSINPRNKIDINPKEKTSFHYNVDFMNFLLEVYEALINNDLKNSYTNFLMELFLGLDNLGNGAKRYKWIIKNTKYPEIVLESIIKLKETNLLSCYLSKILFLSMPNDKQYYKPYYDINFFFSKLGEIFGEKNLEIGKKFFSIIASQIFNLININDTIIELIYTKCDIFNESLSIFNSNTFTKEIKNILLEFLNKVLSLNKKQEIKFKFNFPITNEFDLEDNFNLNDTDTYGLKYKLYLLFFNSYIETKDFIDNVNKILDNIKNFGENKKILEVFVFIDLFFESFLFNDNIKYINEFTKINFDKINDIFFKLPSLVINEPDEKTEIYANKFIELIIFFISSFNLRIMDSKQRKLFLKYKSIFTENSLFTIFKNIFGQINDFNLKNKIIGSIISCNFSNNKEIKNRNLINKLLVQSPFIILIILKVFYNKKDFNSILKVYENLLELINISLINIKIILGCDIISFTIKLLINSYYDNYLDDELNRKKCCDKAIEFLKILVSFLNQSSLIKYLYSIFHIFYETITDFENKNGEKNKKIILILFSILKDSLSSFYNKQKQNHQYLSLSKKVFPNPFVYNIFYMNNLQIEEPIIHYNFDIRINSYENIDKFYIMNLINDKDNLNFFISLENGSKLIIGEKNTKTNKIEILVTYYKINNYLLIDNKFHNISIIIDKENKSIKTFIDYKKINSEKKIVHYKNFNFEIVNLFIGYEFDIVNDYQNKNIQDNAPIIDIANLLITNFQNDADNFLINKQKENLKFKYDMDNVIEYLCIQKKEKHLEFILAEIGFNSNKIKIMNSKYIEGNNSVLDKYLLNESGKIYKYISYFDNFHPLKSHASKFYMCSLNKNIEEYFCLNHFLFPQNLNKIYFQNIFCEELNIFISSSNYIFIDFLLGFFFDIDKRRELLEENTQFNNEQKIEILNDEYITEYVLIIFEIIFSIKNKNILKYYLSDADKFFIPIKIRIFFKNNIYLLNNLTFLNKFIELLLKKKEYFLLFSVNIFIDLIIFSLLNMDNQNIILLNIQSLFKKKKEEIENIDPLKKYFLDKLNIEEELNPLLLEKLLEKLIYLILYCPLSSEEIKEKNNEKQIDIILNIIKSILEKLNYEQYIKIINNTNAKIQNFNNAKENHNFESFFEKNENVLSKENSIIDNQIINNQIDLLNKFLSDFIDKPTNIILENNLNKSNDSNEILDNNDKNNLKINPEDELNENNISDINNNNNINEKLNNDNKKLTNCNFCQYLIDYFRIGINDFFGEIKYEKNKNLFYRYIFLNFKEYREKLGLNKYAWFITGKEGCHCFQNKFFIKENNIKSFIPTKKKKKLKDLFSYKYDSNPKRFKKLSFQLQKIFSYDKLSIDNHFINSFKENNNFLIENCLLINRLSKTFSLFILQNEYIIILTKIFVDKENQLNICFAKPELDLWCIKNEEYLNELDKYIKNNEIEYKKIFEEKKEENTNKKDNGFGLGKNYRFSVKKFKISEINEMHKTSFLQVPNSIEIITNNGKSYFLCFNIDRRDDVFYSIIEAISNKYSDNNNIKNNKKLVNILKKSYKPNSNEIIYMKNCPNCFSNIQGNKCQKIINSNPKLKINKSELYNRIIIEKSILINELVYYWTKNKISNFDYLMLLNILAERSLINLSQYTIFPLIICNFDQSILNHMNESIYRDLSLPIFVCYPFLTNNLKELNSKVRDQEDNYINYFSGIFYSTYAYVAYYLIRQHPFTELHLEIQSGEFDTADRLFIGQKELSCLEDKHQELIPFLFTLPELYLNTNSYLFGKSNRSLNGEKISEFVNDFILPNWADDDQRKFTLYLKRLLESKNVSQKLHSWIDLIFGYKMIGDDAVKCYNTYRKACYESSKEEIEKAYSDGMLLSVLIEKYEMGYLGKQLFKKQHKKKEVTNEGFKENENNLFDKVSEMKHLKLNKLNIDSKSDKKMLKINDIIIKTQNEYINSSLNRKNHYFQGGISSLKSIMNVLNNESYSQYNKINFQKLIYSFEKESKFLFLDKKCILLGDPVNRIFLNYNKRIIRIIYNAFNVYSIYYLNEIGNISIIVANSEGTKLYIGFDNGNIILYKIKLYENEKDLVKEKDYIHPFKKFLMLSKEKSNSIINLNINKKNEIEQPPNIVLEKILSNNNYIMNNIHIPSKIRKLSLDEKNNVLIALTNKNIIHIISINNNFKLMNTIYYLVHLDYNFKMKNIITFADNGDFLIYSSLSVHLFSINGVPLCELNLLKEYTDISKISYCSAIFSGDIILFTGHKDGSLIIWKMKTKKFDQKKKFLSEYYYNYSFNFDLTNIKNCELRRQFEIITKIEQSNDMKTPVKYMTISNDMNYMLIINKNKDIFLLNGKIDNDNNKKDRKESENIIKKGENAKTKKIICNICKKEYTEKIQDLNNNIEKSEIQINNNEIRKVSEFEIVDKDELVDKIIEERSKIEDENICDNCKNNLENYLYNF